MTKLRLLFCSYHSYLDPASGAALSTRDLFELAAAQGWPCAVLSGPRVDGAEALPLDKLLRAEGLPFQFRPGEVAGVPCTLYHCVRNGVALHFFVPTINANVPEPTQEQGRAFLSLFDLTCQKFQPDLLITYGGQWLASHLYRLARKRGAKIVFSLRNLDYNSAELFKLVDAVLVPSRFAQEHYQHKLGIASTAIPGPWNWEQVRCPKVEGRYVTFVNPQPAKGAFWFARMAEQLHQRRPDIPLLVVEGRGQVNWLEQCDLDLSGLRNLHRMANTPDPKHFYQVSKIVLMPSLWRETFGRVAVEAMINGIPVLASRRGALPEALAGSGFLFDIPETYQPNSRTVPTAEEAAPWLAIIERLWDDEDFYRQESARCLEAAETFKPERLWPRFEAFFQSVLNPTHGQ